ncbi:MAG: LacI family DNA-binding transcriptional regulator [Chloroflexota bacterium]
MTDRPVEPKKRATIKDVARAAGVSPGLVSIVFNDVPGASDANRERVRQVARELGYQPDRRASLLRRRHSRLLGVEFFVRSAFHGDLLPGIYAAAKAAGYEVALSGWTAERPEKQAIRALIGFRCDALILIGTELPEPVLADLVEGLPTVVVTRRLTSPIGDTIYADDGFGIRLAVEHLASLGHRAIVHVDGGPNNANGVFRAEAYQAAMEALGLGDRIRVLPGGQTVEAGAAAAARLLEARGDATAVVAFNDDLAWGMLAALQGSSISVPGDLSIVGYDGSHLSRIMPLSGLTTVRQDVEGLARLAVERAVARVEGAEAAGSEVILETTLAIGSSTGPASVR